MDADSAVPQHNEHLVGVLEIVSKLAAKAAVADYIYRGETEWYDEISSSFYRELRPKPPAGFDVDQIQVRALDEARRFTVESDELTIMAELQHYGGKTNLIDFTADCHIALFFACDGRHSEDGRVIFLERNGDMQRHIHEPRNPANRVIAQKSVFVRPPFGYIEVGRDDIVTIPRHLKLPILNYLHKMHGISAETVYNDLHGFIRYNEIHQDAFKHLTAGLTKHLNGDYPGAIDSLSESLDLNPLSFTYHIRGLAYISISKYDDAIEDYDRAIAIDPDYVVAYSNRSVAKSHKGDYDGAIADCSNAVAIDPNYSAAYNNRGAAKLRKGDYDGAIADCSESISIDPNRAATYNTRGAAKAHKGDYDGAIADYDRSIAIEPNNANAYNNRGVDKFSKGDYAAAIDDFSRAIELDPDDASAYSNRGESWLHLSEWDNARADLTVAKGMGMDIVASFCNAYASVADFEQRTGLTVPADIAEMLGG